MERRFFERIQTFLLVKFSRRDSTSYGVVMNISENGMYIDTGICLPVKSNFDVLVPMPNGETLNVSAKLSRLIKTGGFYDGIGVELLNPPKNYLKFVAELRTVS